MGRKLDALFGRTFKASKFKSLLNLAISRLAILKNQRQIRCSQARSDVSQLLELGHHDSALSRVEQMIKEQNMLDVFVMAEGYCNLLIERVHVIEQERECPEELKEAISSLLFAASRIGEFPELQEIRAVITIRYGKELAVHSMELRQKCGVNPKMVQKLSTRQTEPMIRLKVLKTIAAEKNIVLKLEEDSTSTKESSNISPKPGTSANSIDREEMADEYGVCDSIRTKKKKYKDVADAAQAAFESAAYAAEAARAAMELSRSDSHDPDDNDSNNTHRKNQSNGFGNKKHDSEAKQESNNNSYEAEEPGQDNEEVESKGFMSDSDTDSEEVVFVEPAMSFREQDPVKLLDKETVIYDSEEETGGIRFNTKTGKIKDGANRVGKTNAVTGFGHGEDHLKGEKGPVSVRTRQVRGY